MASEWFLTLRFICNVSSISTLSLSSMGLKTLPNDWCNLLNLTNLDLCVCHELRCEYSSHIAVEWNIWSPSLSVWVQQSEEAELRALCIQAVPHCFEVPRQSGNFEPVAQRHSSGALLDRQACKGNWWFDWLLSRCDDRFLACSGLIFSHVLVEGAEFASESSGSRLCRYFASRWAAVAGSQSESPSWPPTLYRAHEEASQDQRMRLTDELYCAWLFLESLESIDLAYF